MHGTKRRKIIITKSSGEWTTQWNRLPVAKILCPEIQTLPRSCHRSRWADSSYVLEKEFGCLLGNFYLWWIIPIPHWLDMKPTIFYIFPARQAVELQNGNVTLLLNRFESTWKFFTARTKRQTVIIRWTNDNSIYAKLYLNKSKNGHSFRFVFVCLFSNIY